MLWLWATVFRLLLVLSQLPYCQAYRRIMGMNIAGQPIVNRVFQYTYYYLKKIILLEKILHLHKIQLCWPRQTFVNFLQ